MLISPLARRRAAVALALILGSAAAIAAFVGAGDALAQAAGPFGVPRPPASAPPAPPPDGIAGWIMAKQAEFYRAMSGTIRAARTDGSALWALFGVAFLYGVFHAAGPGHGKAVISSYMLANEETWKRGVVLSFASAMLQAVVAVTIVGIAAVLLNATARQMCDAERVIEIVSYALIAALGARLVWVKGKAFLTSARGVGAAATPPEHRHDHGHTHGHSHDRGHDHSHDPAHAHHSHAHDHGDHHHGHGHDHHHHEHHASAWGHAHGPEPHELAGPGGWKRGLAAIVAVGLRPCSGAILVLVFALAQGLFWAGVAATFIMGLGTAITVAAIATLAVGAKSLARRFASSPSGYGMLTLRGIEVAAAFLVLAFGALLLMGYMAAERGACL